MKTTILHNMAVFFNGDYKIGAGDVTLPTYKQKTITKHFPGTKGEIKIPVGVIEAMDISVKSSDIYLDVLKEMGCCDCPQRVVFRTIEKDVINCDRDNHIITLEGIWEEANLGGLKTGEESERSYNLSLRKYKHQVNGETIIDYDALAPDEEDRAALGL